MADATDINGNPITPGSNNNSISAQLFPNKWRNVDPATLDLSKLQSAEIQRGQWDSLYRRLTYMAIWPLALRMLVPPAPPLAILLSEIMIKLWLMPPFPKPGSIQGNAIEDRTGAGHF